MKTLILFLFLFGVVAEVTVYGLIEKSCPLINPVGCLSGYRTLCCNNDDCKNGQVCCMEMCETKCMDPMKNGYVIPLNMTEEECHKFTQPSVLPIKDGLIEKRCPLINPVGCLSGYKTLCCNNDDCKNGQVCCMEMCETKCMDPMKNGYVIPLNMTEEECHKFRQPSVLPIKDGLIEKTCPLINPVGCLSGYKTHCCNNDDCKNGQVCCMEMCETKCMDPMKNGYVIPLNMTEDECHEFRQPSDNRKVLPIKEVEIIVNVTNVNGKNMDP